MRWVYFVLGGGEETSACVSVSHLSDDVADGAAAVAALAEVEADGDGGIEMVPRDVAAREIQDQEHEADGDCIWDVDE